MIYVDRNTVTPLQGWQHRAELALGFATRFFQRRRSSRLQQRFNFNGEIWWDAEAWLRMLFHDKCAYCETAVLRADGEGQIEHFRPFAEAIGWTDPDRDPDQVSVDSHPDGYWWLAYEWSNLYLSCATCARNKLTRFPVVGKRASQGTRGRDLLGEQVLLIDPCVHRPELFLHVERSGVLRALVPPPYARVSQAVGRRSAGRRSRFLN